MKTMNDMYFINGFFIAEEEAEDRNQPEQEDTYWEGQAREDLDEEEDFWNDVYDDLDLF